METNLKTPKTIKKLKILLIGNNPVEMGSILNKLAQIRTPMIVSEFAFGISAVFEKLVRFFPDHILIDDNIGKAGLIENVKALARNKKTKRIPITVIKNSNYTESAVSSDIIDYALKEGFSAEALMKSLENSSKIRTTQLYLHQALKKRKSHLSKLVGR